MPTVDTNAVDTSTNDTKDLTKKTSISSAEKLPVSIDSKSSTASPKKRKRSSPFRIKTGCVVALRFCSQENNIKLKSSGDESPVPLSLDDESKLLQVWTSPRPHRDEGLALVGKRIRCLIPATAAGGIKGTSIEGTVVGLLDYGITKRPTSNRPIKVELLVEKSHAARVPALRRLDEDVDVSKLDKKDRRLYLLEQKVRGPDQITVFMKLTNPSCPHQEKAIKWSIRKTVPARLFRQSKPKQLPDATENGSTIKKSDNESYDVETVTLANEVTLTSAKRPSLSHSNGKPGKKRNMAMAKLGVRYLGDGNDPDGQQIANWRCLASRYHETIVSSLSSLEMGSHGAEILSGGFIGEVLRVDASIQSESSLAEVTLRRLLLPEHLPSGRLAHHGLFDVFDDRDNRAGLATSSPDSSLTIQVPVEQLVVLKRKLHRETPGSTSQFPEPEDGTDCLFVSHSYSFMYDAFFPIQEADICARNEAVEDLVSASSITVCHRCRQMFAIEEVTKCTFKKCPSTVLATPTMWCQKCIKALSEDNGDEPDPQMLPCCLGICSCRECLASSCSLTCSAFWNAVSRSIVIAPSRRTDDSPFEVTKAVLGSLGKLDFALPVEFVDFTSLPKPSVQKCTRTKTPKQKKALKSRFSRLIEQHRTTNKKASRHVPTHARAPFAEDHIYSEASCARHVSFDPSRRVNKLSFAVSSMSTGGGDRPRNLRQNILERKGEAEKDEKSSSRAARAHQRRLFKDVAAFGAVGFVDTLGSREPQIRFDRSGIHAWGVFADEDIAAEVFITEYRGEIICNAVAEKRERQYTVANIGSDYMFRIDREYVCDATKQGNVARFINHSCDPNCYTKVITADGNKRISIYAKRDIRVGEELCYDYKFPLEYDEMKRIPCHCGTKGCRGFMNWDKRYIAILPEEAIPKSDGDASEPELSSPNAVSAVAESFETDATPEQTSNMESDSISMSSEIAFDEARVADSNGDDLIDELEDESITLTSPMRIRFKQVSRCVLDNGDSIRVKNSSSNS